ncbi:hypothetical protein D9M71_757720 [compost metagenome]
MVYPNPTNTASLLNIKLSNENAATYNLVITNSSGQVVFENKNYNLEEQYHTGNLSKGIYFVTIQSQNFKETKKIIVK